MYLNKYIIMAGKFDFLTVVKFLIQKLDVYTYEKFNETACKIGIIFFSKITLFEKIELLDERTVENTDAPTTT